MKKASVGRSSKGPIRLSNRLSSRGNIGIGLPADFRTSSGRPSSETRAKSHIPVPKTGVRASSSDRESRPRMRPVNLSSKKKSIISHATPSTPATQYFDMPVRSSSAQSTRSRSGSRCGSAERLFKPQLGKLSETRPIKDPSFQYRAMVRVYNYFQRQPQAIRDLCPPPNTRSIMIQSFVDMMGHLLQHFFYKHGVYKKNYTEEIPKFMKKLYYPGNMSSSWLKTVNAPHAWPHVVAAISWLVDLVVLRENINLGDFFKSDFNGEKIPHEQQVQMHQITFHSFLESFLAWNDEDDAKAIEIDAALEDSLKAMQGFSDNDMDRLAKENAELLEELNDPVELELAENYASIVDRVKTLALKEKEAASAIQTIEHSIEKLQTQEADSIALCEKLEKALASKTSMQDQLALTIATQSISIDDANAIKEEIRNTEQEIKNNNSYLAELDKKGCKIDLQMQSIKDKLNVRCVNFNKEILQSNFTELHQFTIQTNLNFSVRDLKQARLEMEKINIGLEQLISNLNEKMRSADCSLEKHDEILKDLKTESKRVKDKVKALEEEQLNNDKELQALEAESEKKESDFKAEYDAIKVQTAQLVKTNPDIEGMTEELNKCRAQESESQREMETMFKMSAEFLREEAKALENYEKQVLKDMSEILDS